MIKIYLSLENKTNDLGLIIHFDEKNFDTFGIEIYNLLFLSCNLFERLAKKICNDNGSKMDIWKQNKKIREYSNEELTFIPMDYKFKPMEALGNEKIKDRKLIWWKDYNSVKHNLSDIHKATLRNLIYALSSTGLLLSRVTYPEYSSDYPSKLFSVLFIPDGFYNSSINVTVVGETEDKRTG